MPNSSGTKIAMVIFGIITAILVPSLFFMGTNVIANDKANTEDHTEIRKELNEKIDKVEEIVTDIRLEQRTIIESLKRIENK